MDDFIVQNCSAAAASPAAPSAGTPTTNEVYTIQVLMAGDVKDFDTKSQESARNSVASYLGISATDVTVTLNPGSIVANFQIARASAASVMRMVGQLNDKSWVPDSRFPVLGATVVTSASAPAIFAGTQAPLATAGRGTASPTAASTLNIPAPPVVLLGTLPPVAPKPVYVSPVLRPLAASSASQVRWTLLILCALAYRTF
jgi:hypothetical protein